MLNIPQGNPFHGGAVATFPPTLQLWVISVTQVVGVIFISLRSKKNELYHFFNLLFSTLKLRWKKVKKFANYV